MIYPVVLHTIIPNVAAGRIGNPLDQRGLQNRTEKTLRIREIIIDIEQQNLLGSDATGTFGKTAIQLRLRGTPITSGYVPLAAMATPIDISAGNLASVATEQPPFAWRFSKPVLLSPGDALSVSIQDLALGSGPAASYRVFAVCDEAPSTRPNFMPWCAAFAPASHADGTGVFEEISTEADLVNPFDQEMLIERFIGRVRAGTQAEVGLSANGFRFFDFDAIRLRMEDHRDRSIVRDPTPFATVFNMPQKSWIVNTILERRGYYRATVEFRLAPQVTTGAGNPVVYPVIGMIGYREVR